MGAKPARIASARGRALIPQRFPTPGRQHRPHPQATHFGAGGSAVGQTLSTHRPSASPHPFGLCRKALLSRSQVPTWWLYLHHVGTMATSRASGTSRLTGRWLIIQYETPPTTLCGHSATKKRPRFSTAYADARPWTDRAPLPPLRFGNGCDCKPHFTILHTDTETRPHQHFLTNRTN